MNFFGDGETAYLATGLVLLALAVALVLAGAWQQTPPAATLTLAAEGAGATYSTQAGLDALLREEGTTLYFSPMNGGPKQPSLRCEVLCEIE